MLNVTMAQWRKILLVPVFALCPFEAHAFLGSLAGELIDAAAKKISENLDENSGQEDPENAPGEKVREAEEAEVKADEKHETTGNSVGMAAINVPCVKNEKEAVRTSLEKFFEKMPAGEYSYGSFRLSCSFDGGKSQVVRWSKREEAKKALAAIKPIMGKHTVFISNPIVAVPLRVSACAWMTTHALKGKGDSKGDWIRITDQEFKGLFAWLVQPDLKNLPLAEGASMPGGEEAEKVKEAHLMGSAMLGLAINSKDPLAQAALKKREFYWVEPRKMSKMPSELAGKWKGKKGDGSTFVVHFYRDKYLDFGDGRRTEAIVNPVNPGKYMLGLERENDVEKVEFIDLELRERILHWGEKGTTEYVKLERF